MLSIQNLSKSCGFNTVLKNINLNLDWEECAALVCPHGCGESTLLNIIAISPSGMGMGEYPGNYSQYLAIRQSEFDAALMAYVDQQEEIKRQCAQRIRPLFCRALCPGRLVNFA